MEHLVVKHARLWAGALMLVGGALASRPAVSPAQRVDGERKNIGVWLPPAPGRDTVSPPTTNASASGGATVAGVRSFQAIDTMYTAADTQVLRPGWLDFRSYTLEMCTRAIENVRRVMRRPMGDDTLPYAAQARQPVPAEAVWVGRTCGARYLSDAVARVTSGVSGLTFLRELRLALDVQDDTLARALVERHLAHVANSPIRTALALFDVFDTYMSVRPVRVELAAATLARLDALGNAPPEPTAFDDRGHGVDVASVRWEAHEHFLEHWLKLTDATGIRRALGAYLRVCEELLARTDLFPELRARIESRRIDAVRWQFDVTFAQDGPKSAGVAAAFVPYAKYALGEAALVKLQVEQIYDSVFHPPDSAVVWARGPASTSSDSSVHIAPGRLTLFIPVSHNCYLRPCCGIGPAVEGNQECYSLYQMLRRLYSTYGPRGLDIVVWDQTAGYSSGSVAQTPREEVESIKQYFFTHLQLPVAALAIGITPFHRNSDGVRVNDAATFQQQCYNPLTLSAESPLAQIFQSSRSCISYGRTMLIDRQGKIRGIFWKNSETLLSMHLDRLLAP